MTAATPAPRKKNPVTYAETELGVHEVYEAAHVARDTLDGYFSEVATKRDERRRIESAIEDREADLLIEEYSKHADMSVAAMERHMKSVKHRDEELRKLKPELASVISDIEGLEYDIRVAEADVRIAVARMTELGGYLTYLAAAKNSTTGNQSSQRS